MLERIETRLCTGIVFLVVWFVLFFTGYTPLSARILSVFSILLVLVLLLRAWVLKNELMILLSLFMLSYSKVSTVLFFDGIPISGHEAFALPEYVFDVMVVHAFFLIVLGMSLEMQRCTLEKKPRFFRNDILFYFSCFVFLIGIIFGIRGENMFISGGYSTGAVETGSMNEYVIIFFICAYIYSGGTRTHLAVLNVLAFVFVLKNLAFGGRIVSLMLILVLFILHYRYQLRFRTFVALALAGYLFMFAFESIRQNPWAFVNGDYETLFFSGQRNETVHISNQGDVVQASSRLIAMVREHIMQVGERVDALFYFLISIFFPYSYLPPLANLAVYKADVYVSAGGGLVSAYFYVFGGFFAVAGAAVYIGRFLSPPLHGKYTIRFFYFVMVAFTFPRWFAYNPIILFKLCFYGVIVFIFYRLVDRTMKRRALPHRFFIRK